MYYSNTENALPHLNSTQRRQPTRLGARPRVSSSNDVVFRTFPLGENGFARTTDKSSLCAGVSDGGPWELFQLGQNSFVPDRRGQLLALSSGLLIIYGPVGTDCAKRDAVAFLQRAAKSMSTSSIPIVGLWSAQATSVNNVD